MSVHRLVGAAQPAARRRRGTRWAWLDAGVVFLVALATRVALVRAGGGLRGTPGYDAAVYYTAADALIHGRLPYLDFTLLHPPGLILALTPFAKLGTMTSDVHGYAVARGVFVVLGAVNAVLVMRVARRFDVSRLAAAAGGLFYALCPGSIGAARATRLEPLGSLLLLLGLLLLLRGRATSRGAAWLLLAGACLGASAMVKIWGVVPLLVVLAWQLLGGGPARILRTASLAAGAGVAMAVIGGPFFLAAPRQMVQMVVLDQVGRHPTSPRPLRFDTISGMVDAFPGSHPSTYQWLLVIVAGLSVAVLVAAWVRHRGRAIVLLTALQIAVIFAAPSFFPWYVEFVAPTFGVCVALAIGGSVAVRRRRQTSRALLWTRPTAAVLLVVEALVTTLWLAQRSAEPLSVPSLSAVSAATARMRCVMSDDPGLLLQLDRTSRNLANGCPNWVDVTGRTYGPPDRPGPTGRHADLRWQLDLRRYLTSGQAVITDRPLTGMNYQTKKILRSGGFLAAASPTIRVYAITRHSRCLALHSDLHHLARAACRGVSGGL